MRLTKYLHSNFFLILFLPIFSIAQTTSNHLNVGVQGGYSLTDIRYANADRLPKYSSANGYHIGLNLTYVAESKFRMSFEPGLILKGGGMHDINLKLTYLVFPILLKYQLTNRFQFGFGLEAGNLRKAVINNEYLVYHPVKPDGNENDITFDYNRFDFSAVAGIDFTVLKRTDLYARYSYALTPLEKLSLSNNIGTNIKVAKLYNLSFSIGVRFKVIK